MDRTALAVRIEALAPPPNEDGDLWACYRQLQQDVPMLDYFSAIGLEAIAARADWYVASIAYAETKTPCA